MMNKNWVAVLAGLALLSVPACAAEVETGTGTAAFRAGDLIEFRAPEPVKMISADEMGIMFDAMSGYTPEEQTLVINDGTYFHYYERLDPVAREMYDIMLEVAKDPVSEDNLGLMMTTIDPDSDEFFDEWCLAYLGLTYDHPELFWLYSYNHMIVPYSDGGYANGVYYVLFGMDEPYEEYEEEMTAFNNAANLFLQDIDTSVSDYEIIRQVHDKLVAMVSYDTDEASGLADDAYSHTAYSMLVKNSRGIEHYGVCDGYSLAFEYLLQQCGVKVVFNAGLAGSPEDEAAGLLGGHAWNMVMLNGMWYEVDSTWDDNIMEDLEEYAQECEVELVPGTLPDDYMLEAFHNLEYRYALDHFLYLLSTEELRHFHVADHDELYYTTTDGEFTFSLLEGNDSVHVRFEPGSGPQGGLLNLAPVAESSWTA
ncbi:MAG: hypothetical protein K6C06_02915 [Lachnospiraceae bacterium]|nr:hypothetical protein [Lachnospiraceae bacterium]